MKPGIRTILAITGILALFLLAIGCTSTGTTISSTATPAATMAGTPANVEANVSILVANEGSPIQHDYLAIQTMNSSQVRHALEELRADSSEYYFDFKDLNPTTEKGKQLRTEMMTYFSNVNSYAINMVLYTDTKDDTYLKEAKPYQEKINQSLANIRNLYGDL